MPAILLTVAEQHALVGLPHAAIALYIWLRGRMDFRTAIVGAPVGISWQALVECLYIEPHSGPLPPSPGREAVRRINGWLVRAGLVRLRSNANQAQLLFYLPLAQTISRARKQPDRNPTGQPDRGRTEGQSTGTRPRVNGPTRQTSGNGVISAAAAIPELRGAQAPDRAELVLPPGTTPAEERAFGAIARKHQLTRDVLQLLLDELAHKRRNGAVRNGAAFIERLAQQHAAGEFYAVGADIERGGGAGLSAEEARFINEGGSSHNLEQ